jgi:hypothetical protein
MRFSRLLAWQERRKGKASMRLSIGKEEGLSASGACAGQFNTIINQLKQATKGLGVLNGRPVNKSEENHGDPAN